MHLNSSKYQDKVVLDISLAKKKLGYKPKISIEKGIHLYVDSDVFMNKNE